MARSKDSNEERVLQDLAIIDLENSDDDHVSMILYITVMQILPILL